MVDFNDSAGKASVEKLPIRSRMIPSARSGRTIGILHPCYGYERVSYALPVERYDFERVVALPLNRLERPENTFLQYTPVVVDANAALLHTWNALPVSTAPFVVSFENELPRYLGKSHPWQHSIGHSILASPRCRALLAMSDTAAKLARDRFEDQGLPEIARRIITFRGGVEAPASIPAKEPVTGRPLKLLFVGGDAYRKGIIPSFRALRSLHNSGVELEFTAIARMNPASYAVRDRAPSEKEFLAELTGESWVRHYPALPYEQIVREMVDHDVLLFPSLDETLGWVVIEAALHGVPSITTNVFAFPELIEHRTSGYLINLQLGHQLRWKGLWTRTKRLESELEEAYESIAQGLKEAVEGLVNEPSLAASWGRAARARLLNLYSPENAATELQLIYDRALDC